MLALPTAAPLVAVEIAPPRKADTVMKFAIAINSIPLTSKIPLGDPLWARYNDSFVNQELEPVEIANQIYTGHSYAGWHNGRRSLANFIQSSFIAVDMDTGDERSSFDHLRRHDLVRMYAGLMHTTPSHSIAAPRARVIFLLDQPITDAAGYQRAAKFLIAQFGADPACSDASRFFYGHQDCAIWLSDNVLPLAHLRRFYRKHGKEMMAAETIHKPTPPPSVLQPSAKTPPPTDKLTEVAEALKRIDPWSIDYARWIGVMAALHDEFGDSALPVARQWAAGKEGEVDAKWRTFGKYGGKRATLASIFDLAKSH